MSRSIRAARLRTAPKAAAVGLSASPTPLPLGALAAGFGLLLAGSVCSAPVLAQSTSTELEPTGNETTLRKVIITGTIPRTGKDSLRATTTTIGKGRQELRDIPQSVTVVTEKLIDDRNLDTMKEVLKNTSGITFLAAEGGEEDIRLRGFSLQAAGDVFVDGMRDPAFYERDTFFLDRVEVLRGSASLLFGRGSSGGAVNQVTKVPRLITEHEVDLTLGSHHHARLVGDFNIKTGDSAALRLGAMVTQADNDGSGNSLDKRGIAGSYRWGIGERDEFQASLYHLDNRNGMNYGMPWIRPTASSPVSDTTLMPIAPESYYGMASDRNNGLATQVTLSHVHRFSRSVELTTKLRTADYERDQRAGTVRFAAAAQQPDRLAVSLATFGPSTVLSRGTQLKIQDMQTAHAQSDLSAKFEALGLRHELLTGVDFAQEKKQVYAARSAAQGGVNLNKPTTSVGTPGDGAAINEDSRVLRTASDYVSRGYGLYVQDLVQITPTWKLLAGLRFDHLSGDYTSYAIPTNAAGPDTTTGYRMTVSELSKRVGVLYQPSDRLSFHLSGATSFNTSGDAYSLSAANVGIPPEQTVNVELGAKIDSEDGNFSTRLALFRSTKLHERNTDPLVNLVTLSGKRHAAGVEIDVSGRLSRQWEVYASYLWMPVAKIDKGVAGSEGEGTRPSQTPRHSGTVWSTYQLTPRLRLGGGLTAMSSQTPIRNPGWAAPSYVTADLMAEYAVIPNRLMLKANLANVGDKLYASALYSGHYIPGPGRALQVTASYKF